MTEALAYQVQDAARLLGIGRTKLLQEQAAGRIHPTRIGRRMVFTREAIEEYVALLTSEAEAARRPTPAPATSEKPKTIVINRDQMLALCNRLYDIAQISIAVAEELSGLVSDGRKK